MIDELRIESKNRDNYINQSEGHETSKRKLAYLSIGFSV